MFSLRFAHNVIGSRTCPRSLRYAASVYLEPSQARRSGPNASVFQNIDGPVQMSSKLPRSWIAHVSRHADLVTKLKGMKQMGTIKLVDRKKSERSKIADDETPSPGAELFTWQK